MYPLLAKPPCQIKFPLKVDNPTSKIDFSTQYFLGLIATSLSVGGCEAKDDTSQRYT